MSAATATPTPGPDNMGVIVTDDNLNPVVQIVTWVLLACTSLMVAFRFLSRYFLTKHRLAGGWDDILLLVSYILCVGEMVAWVLPQSSVFGRSIGQTSPDEIESGIMVMYAANILFLLSLGFAKLSVCACYINLIPANDMFHRHWSLITAAVIVLWTVSFTFSAAFRCGVRPWWDVTHPDAIMNPPICVDQTALLQSISITNILTDVGLAIIPISLMAPLSLPARTRAATISIFSVRALLTVPSCAFQLVYIPTLAQDNWTLKGFPYFVATQVVEFVGVSTACIIYLSPFLQSLGDGVVLGRETTLLRGATLKGPTALSSG